jgi:competence protein ComEC
METHDQDGQPRESPRRPRYQPLVVVVLAVALGIVLDRYGSATVEWLGFRVQGSAIAGPEPEPRTLNPVSPSDFVLWCYLSAGCLMAWWLARQRRRDAAAAWLLLAAVVLAGGAWHHLRWNLFSAQEIGRYAALHAEPACVEVIARQSPQDVPAPRPTALRAIPVDERSRLDVELVAIRDRAAWLPAAGECQLTVGDHLQNVRAGDRLQVFGQLRRTSPPQNPGEFDWAAHARAEGRLVSLTSLAPDCVTVINPSSASYFERLLGAIRDGGKRLLERYLAPDRVGLASAILLGSREGLPTEETTSFMLTGTIHVLVVSGLHVGILAMGLYALMRLGWLPRKAGLAVIMAAVVAYALVADARPPVIRAAALTVVVCVAMWTGRRAVAFNSLAAAALVILAINPAELFRAGTQLSFLCVATLIWASGKNRLMELEHPDRLQQLIDAARPWYQRAARQFGFLSLAFLIGTAAVWLTALPLVLYRFHVVTPVAVLISPLVWVLVLMALWSGFALLTVGWLLPPLAALLGIICDASLAGLDRLVHWAAALPGGHFWTPGPACWWVLGFYAGLMLIMFAGRALMARRWQLAALCAWMLVGLVPPLADAWTRDRFECAFVAVGHGTCVVVQSPEGRTLVYDAGSLGSPQYATQSVASYLWHRGISRIDALVLSHADVDHYNAVPGLLERFRVAAVYVSPVTLNSMETDDPHHGPAELRAAILAASVPVQTIWSGDRLRLDSQVTVDVRHPPRFGVVGSNNANSITLAIEYAGRRVLLPGDLESPGIEDVMAEQPYDCDLLLAPHHGSRRSDPPGFAAWSTPEWVVISGGGGREVAPVVKTYEGTGARVLQTDETGAVEFTVDEGRLVATTWGEGSGVSPGR